MNEPRNEEQALPPLSKKQRAKVDPEYVKKFIVNLFEGNMHALRVVSLANGVVGVLHGAALAIHAIGQAYARVAGITPKSGVKQVDRMLSNSGFDLRVVHHDYFDDVAMRADLARRAGFPRA